MKSRIELANEDWEYQKRFYMDHSGHIKVAACAAFLRGYDSRDEEVETLNNSLSIAQISLRSAREIREASNKAWKKQVEDLIQLCEQYKEALDMAKPAEAASPINKSSNYVSFDMAKQLHKAGFPCPAKALFGQYWYSDRYFEGEKEEGVLCISISVSFMTDDMALYAADGNNAGRMLNSIFAPAAQDIQKEFQKQFGGSLDIRYNKVNNLWSVIETTETLISEKGSLIGWTGENAADCAARCFLSNPRKRGS